MGEYAFGFLSLAELVAVMALPLSVMKSVSP